MIDSFTPELVAQNLDAEKAVLGSMVIDEVAMAKGLAMLESADFIRPNHRLIFNALQSLKEQDKPADALVLQDELRKSCESDTDWGGMEYIFALFDVVTTSANVEHYANIVLEKSVLRKLADTGREIVGLASAPDADPIDVRARAQGKLKSIACEKATGLLHISEAMDGHIKHLQTVTDKVGLDGYSFGMSKFDVATGGLGGPMFILLKGDRGQGKTQLIIQPTYNCIRSGQAALLISMDTPLCDMLNRFIAYMTGINSFRLNRPRASDWNAIADADVWLRQQPLWIYKLSGAKVSEIDAYCQMIIGQGYKLGLVVVDYAELLQPEVYHASHEQDLSSTAIGLQNLRDQYQTTVILLSQVNKEGGERWSKALGNAADVIVHWQKIDDNAGVGSGMLRWEKFRKNSAHDISCEYDFRTSRIREVELDNSDPSYPATWPWWMDEEEMDR